ncbi:copper chaperone [Afipia massiliensis]|uniref:Copper chaperone n=1 Tax=Afipia massiliensis TaxID=211460 RepID=A0A840N738_9BRAD|nr:heavy-metal-associated domain-containing protein [Afipia massiliensis]MBB5055000.1 copper chaperone [Afipia massiliensis]
MVYLKISNMNCGGCAATVTKALKSIDADARIDVDQALKIVRLESRAGVEQISAVLRSAGYPAEVQPG